MIIRSAKQFSNIKITHDIGLHLVAPNKNYSFVPIPKNASTFFGNFLSTILNWEEREYNIQIKTVIVFVRDPLERWYTGITEYFLRQNKSFRFENTNILELFQNKLVFDEHTLPQVNFLDKLDTENIFFLKIDNNIDDNFIHLLQHELGYSFNKKDLKTNDIEENYFNYRNFLFEIPTSKNILKNNLWFKFSEKNMYYFPDYFKKSTISLNSSNEQPIKVENINFLKNTLEANPEYIDKIKKIYENDYELLNNVTFYDKV